MSTNTKEQQVFRQESCDKQAAQAVPAGLYVGLIERLMRLSTRLGIADGDSVEHFAASLEDRLYAICRSAESLLDSLAPAAPAPEAQNIARTSPVHQPAHGWTDADADAARLALELECLLTDGDVPMPVASRWWESAHDALALHRQRLESERAAAPQAAQAVPAVRVADVGFRWEGEKQQHVPTLLLEFEPVPANSGSDAKGWRDRDAMAAMLAERNKE